jgi:transcriptional regulator with XRE-family HTH domain
MGYGARVKTYREIRGMTQDDLARETGIPSTAISRIERGSRKVTLEEAVVLAEVLRVTLAQLAGVEELALEQSHNAQRLLVKKCHKAIDDLVAAFQDIEALVAS